MADKEKLEKLKKLADAMYYAAQYLTTDASRLHKAMDEYHQFIINEYHKEEPVTSVWHDAKEEPNQKDSIIIAYDNCCTVEPSFKDFKSYSEWKTIKQGYRVKQWAYVKEVLNITRKEEPVSEDLEEAAVDHYKDVMEYEVKTGLKMANMTSFKAGAKWQLNQIRKQYEEDRD